jgi:hypothetical protein
MEYVLFLTVGPLPSAYVEYGTHYYLMRCAMIHDPLHIVYWLQQKKNCSDIFLTVLRAIHALNSNNGYTYKINIIDKCLTLLVCIQAC